MLSGNVMQSILHRLDPETAHELALDSLIAAQRLPGGLALLRQRFCEDDPSLHTRAFGLEFPSPIGLAAGFDKNARAVQALAALGFGAVEVGGVTAEPLSGNPRPRIWRYRQRQALVNWMGLPNDGAEVIAGRLAALKRRQFRVPSSEFRVAPVRPEFENPPGQGTLKPGNPDPSTFNLQPSTPLGLNVAGETVDDYLRVLERCGPFVNYVTLNVSCPNLAPGRQLSDPAQIRALLEAVREMPDSHRRPALLKISPDLDTAEIDALTDLALEGGAAGMVATNTSAALAGYVREGEVTRGGLSGAPLRDRSTAVIRRIRRRAGDRLAIIGVGGIFTAEDALEKFLAGACLVQVYTGFIYRGIATARELNRGLHRLLAERGLRSVMEATSAGGEIANGRLMIENGRLQIAD